MARNGWF